MAQRVDNLLLAHHAHKVHLRRNSLFGNEYLELLFQWHEVFMVFQHYYRFKLCFITRLHELRIADDLRRFGRIEVWVFEQSYLENIR